MSRTTNVEVASLGSAHLQVRDVKFVDDHEFVLATSDECEPFPQTNNVLVIPVNICPKLPPGFSESPIPEIPTFLGRYDTKRSLTIEEEILGLLLRNLILFPALTCRIQSSSAHTRG